MCPMTEADTIHLDYRLEKIEREHNELKVSHEEAMKMIKEIHEYICNQKSSFFGFKWGVRSTIVFFSAFVMGIAAVFSGNYTFKELLQFLK